MNRARCSDGALITSVENDYVLMRASFVQGYPGVCFVVMSIPVYIRQIMAHQTCNINFFGRYY